MDSFHLQPIFLSTLDNFESLVLSTEPPDFSEENEAPWKVESTLGYLRNKMRESVQRPVIFSDLEEKAKGGFLAGEKTETEKFDPLKEVEFDAKELQREMKEYPELLAHAPGTILGNCQMKYEFDLLTGQIVDVTVAETQRFCTLDHGNGELNGEKQRKVKTKGEFDPRQFLGIVEDMVEVVLEEENKLKENESSYFLSLEKELQIDKKDTWIVNEALNLGVLAKNLTEVPDSTFSEKKAKEIEKTLTFLSENLVEVVQEKKLESFDPQLRAEESELKDEETKENKPYELKKAASAPKEPEREVTHFNLLLDSLK